MTRASLLHILNHVGSISEAEIRELEQLAAAFPYCQTAHVLLAKAAHDQGSMLASQRLRRAATYAADRQLLRQLLELPAPEASLAGVLAPRELPAPAEASFTTSASAAGGSTAFFQALVTEDVQALEAHEDEAATAAVEVGPETPDAALPDSSARLVPAVTGPEPAAPATAVPEEAVASQSAGGPEEPEIQDFPEPLTSAEAREETPSLVPVLPTTVGQAAIGAESAPPASVIEPAANFVVPAVPASAADAGTAPPPPIRPPAEVGTSRFEFGLSEPAAPLEPILYQLPGLDEQDQPAADAEAADAEYPLFPPAVATTAQAPPFRADPALAYALLAGGSRFGYALQLRDEELSEPLPGTTFFPPDALLHAHAAAQPLLPTPAPSPFDLINRFLKVRPRLKSPGVLPPVQEQADLAAQSTHAPPALASESLAKILVRQGKTDRAIEIYEQLMVRQPEKSAYFADQIQQLKPLE
ncbi:MAG: hypothetical protein H7Z21_07325 [Hymenobacter sp.]|nr:hypothetical protein [Hymenobacter sp.]